MSEKAAPRRILVVDDNKTITDMMANYLSLKSNYDCVVSNSAKSALSLIDTREFDVIILDLSMPEYSGLDLIDYLVANERIKECKIIVFTASSITDKEIRDLIKKGVRSVVRKPIKLTELLEIIKVTSGEMPLV